MNNQDLYVTVNMPDRTAASNLAHVCHAMTPKIPATVKGRNVTVPSRNLDTVRKYLAGKIDPRNYRKNMPKDYYGWTQSIYVRQAM